MSTRQWAPIERTPAGVPEVEAAWTYDHADEVRLVDVREPDEFFGPIGHIEQAELVPLATLAAASRDWDREQPIVVVCHSGGRSGRAAVMLEAQGFRRVASMRGGMLRWQRDGHSRGPAACG